MCDKPPARPAKQYLYHTPDYIGSTAFTSKYIAGSKNYFYSLKKDLQAIHAYAVKMEVPNPVLAWKSIGTLWRHEMGMLSFGGSNDGAPEVLITGGVHAREWIGAEVAYLTAEYLIRNYVQKDQRKTDFENLLGDLVDTRRINFIPMVNPSGISRTNLDEDQRLWRKNTIRFAGTQDEWLERLSIGGDKKTPNPPLEDLEATDNNTIKYKVPRYETDRLTGFEFYATHEGEKFTYVGVDLNRNFPVSTWGNLGRGGGSTEGGPDNEDYFGPKAGSEFETKTVLEFITGKNITRAIDYHSYQGAILIPMKKDQDPNFLQVGRTLQGLIADSEAKEQYYGYSLGSARTIIGYDSYGSVAHWMSERGAVSYTIELEPLPGKWWWNEEFQLSAKHIQYVFEKNIRAALAMMLSAGGGSVEGGSSSSSTGSTLEEVAARLLKWKVWGCGNSLPPG